MPTYPINYDFVNRLPKGSRVSLKILEFGGVQRGSLGGPDVYIRRLGDRFQANVTLPAMEKTLAGDWFGNRAFGYAAMAHMLLELPQYVPAPEAGHPLVIEGAGTGGTFVYLDPLQSGLYKTGQLFNYYQPDRDFHYLHMVTGFAENENGFPLIRVAPVIRDVIVGSYLDFDRPRIQGFITGIEGDISYSRFVEQSFQIIEGR